VFHEELELPSQLLDIEGDAIRQIGVAGQLAAAALQ
jgi:hypothetical protein